jgi:PAS domain-containing protein
VDIIFTRRRVVLAVTLLSILSVTILAYGDWRGFLPLRVIPALRLDVLLVAIFVLSSTGVLSAMSSGALRRNLARVRDHEATLEARNRELQALAQNLAASEQRYRLLFDHASIMAAVYDADGRFILANAATARTLARQRDAIEGHLVSEVGEGLTDNLTGSLSGARSVHGRRLATRCVHDRFMTGAIPWPDRSYPTSKTGSDVSRGALPQRRRGPWGCRTGRARRWRCAGSRARDCVVRSR